MQCFENIHVLKELNNSSMKILGYMISCGVPWEHFESLKILWSLKGGGKGVSPSIQNSFFAENKVTQL